MKLIRVKKADELDPKELDRLKTLSQMFTIDAKQLENLIKGKNYKKVDKQVKSLKRALADIEVYSKNI